MSRSPLGKTARLALQALADHGPLVLSHGRRYASTGPGGLYVMSPTNHTLRVRGMVEWAGGNYDRFHVRLTDYGRECLRRGSHDLDRPAVSFAESYGSGPQEPA